MLDIKFITVGTLKEAYLRDAEAEYAKRLGGLCRFSVVSLKEARLPDAPSKSEIDAALEAEAKAILAAVPQRSYKIMLCVEGKQFSSEELAARIEQLQSEYSTICFVIGSSYGLHESVKKAADLRLSVSKLTFPHQLMRVMLSEAVYRCLNIIKGTKYHK